MSEEGEEYEKCLPMYIPVSLESFQEKGNLFIEALGEEEINSVQQILH